jgi:hypothetical protein
MLGSISGEATRVILLIDQNQKWNCRTSPLEFDGHHSLWLNSPKRARAVFKKREGIYLLLIVAITGAVFSPSLSNGFTNYDDQVYLTDNPLVRTLTLSNIRAIFTTFRAHTVFVPLVTLSYALEYQVWGMNPRGYHAVNLALHILNALMVFLLVVRLFSSKGAAFFTALLFAIHPLRLESVAWITERKDLLFSFFLLLALHVYLGYLKKSRGRNYLLCLFFFALSLLAKLSAIILPLFLLLTDLTQEGRISKKRWQEKIPFFVVSLLFGIFSLINFGESSSGFSPQHTQVLVKNTLWFVPFYLQKTILPIRLSAQYPTDMRFFMPPLWLSLAVSFVLIFGSWLLLKRDRREWIWGWGVFLIGILHVIGLIWYFHPVANRYSYIPAIGLSYILVRVIIEIPRRIHRYQRAVQWSLSALAAVFFVALAVGSFLRCRVWKDSLSLWNDVIEKYPMIPLAYQNRGAAWHSLGRLDDALQDYSQAIRLMPDYTECYWNRGLVWTQKGQGKEADQDFFTAIREDSRYFPLYYRINIKYYGPEGMQRTIDMGTRILEVKPDVSIHLSLAQIYINLRRFADAGFHLKEALRMNPDAVTNSETFKIWQNIKK